MQRPCRDVDAYEHCLEWKPNSGWMDPLHGEKGLEGVVSRQLREETILRAKEGHELGNLRNRTLGYGDGGDGLDDCELPAGPAGGRRRRRDKAKLDSEGAPPK